MFTNRSALFLLLVPTVTFAQPVPRRISLNDYEVGKNTLREIKEKNKKVVLKENGDAGNFLATICFTNQKQTWVYGASDMGGAAREITQVSISMGKPKNNQGCLRTNDAPRLMVGGQNVNINEVKEIKKAFSDLDWTNSASQDRGVLIEKTTVIGKKELFDKSTTVTIKYEKNGIVQNVMVTQIVSF